MAYWAVVVLCILALQLVATVAVGSLVKELLNELRHEESQP
jgi:hypothetical protein